MWLSVCSSVSVKAIKHLSGFPYSFTSLLQSYIECQAIVPKACSNKWQMIERNRLPGITSSTHRQDIRRHMHLICIRKFCLAAIFSASTWGMRILRWMCSRQDNTRGLQIKCSLYIIPAVAVVDILCYISITWISCAFNMSIWDSSTI